MLSYPFLVRALISSALVGGLCGAIGSFVVLKRLSFLSEGIGHASVLGIALGLMLGISPLLSSFLFAIVFATLLAVVTRSRIVAEDAAIGVMFSTALALGVLLLSHRPVFQGDLTRLLFGDVLTISSFDVRYTFGISVAIIGALVFFLRPLTIMIFDEQYAERLGIPTKALIIFLYIVVAVTIISSIRLVGALLVTSLLVVPPSIMLSRVRSFRSLLMSSSLLGVAVGLGGVVLSYVFDTPPGATTVVCAGGFFAVHAVGSLRKESI